MVRFEICNTSFQFRFLSSKSKSKFILLLIFMSVGELDILVSGTIGVSFLDVMRYEKSSWRINKMFAFFGNQNEHTYTQATMHNNKCKIVKKRQTLTLQFIRQFSIIFESLFVRVSVELCLCVTDNKSHIELLHYKLHFHWYSEMRNKYNGERERYVDVVLMMMMIKAFEWQINSFPFDGFFSPHHIHCILLFYPLCACLSRGKHVLIVCMLRNYLYIKKQVQCRVLTCLIAMLRVDSVIVVVLAIIRSLLI